MRLDAFPHIAPLLLITLVCGPSVAQDSEPHQAVLDRIFADWERRRDAMDAVEYHLEGTELVPRGRYTADVVAEGALSEGTTEQVPPEGRVFELERRYVFDFTGNRIRTERRGYGFHVNDVVFFPTYLIDLFDGENVQHLAPRSENSSPEYTPPEYQPEFIYRETKHLNFLLDFDQEPFYLAHGRPPVFGVSLSGFNRFSLPLNREMFRWHAEASMDGRACTVLRTINAPDGPGEIYYEYWVDLGRASAVLRCIWFKNGWVEQLDIDQQETAHGWLPAGYRRTTTSSTGVLRTSYELDVTAIVADPPLSDNLFHAEPEPGMVVRDTASGERYVYEGRGEPRVDVREHYVQKLRETQASHFSRHVAIGLLAVVVLGGIGILVYRSRN